MGSQPGGIPHQGGILYLEFCLRCNVVKACNIAASRSVSLLLFLSSGNVAFPHSATADMRNTQLAKSFMWSHQS